MPCGCGGSTNKYKPRDAKAKADTNVVAPRKTGLPGVWNGPKPIAK